MTANGHRATDPTIAARDGLEAPVGPVLVKRRGLRGRAGVVAVAVGTITIVAAGMGLGGQGPTLDPGTSPSGSTGALTTEGAAIDPRPPGPSRAAPTGHTGSGCRPVDPTDLPELRLWSTAGDAGAVRGFDPTPDPSSTANWPIPGASSTVLLDASSSLVLLPEEEACVRQAIAEYIGVDELGSDPRPLGRGEISLNSPRARVVFGGLPGGDWIVRVVARFSTGGPAGDDEELPAVERFFRVASAGAAAPSVTPLITPAVGCGGPVQGGLLPQLLLAVGDGKPVRGVDLTTYPGDILHNGALASGSFPDPVELRVEDDLCATSWLIDILDPVRGNVYFQLAEINPLEDPAYVSQNRIVIADLPLGRSVVRATVSFGLRQDVHVAWELEIGGPPLPGVEVSASNGARVAGVPGCGTGWTHARGGSAFENCPTSTVPATPNVLSLRDGDVVTVAMPGWSIDGWSAGCGIRNEFAGGVRPLADCGLGGQGDGSAPAGLARFIPFPGRTIAWVWLSASKDGLRVNAQFFVEIIVEP